MESFEEVSLRGEESLKKQKLWRRQKGNLIASIPCVARRRFLRVYLKNAAM
jgi:hypothetical protein